MFRKIRKRFFRCGLSLTEVMVSVAVLSVAIIGTINYRYCAAMDVQKAARQNNAAGIALLLCENWKGIKGSTTYDPVTYLGDKVTISGHEFGPDTPDGFNLLGNYKMVVNGIEYYITLSWKDNFSGTLRTLNTAIVWKQRNTGDTEFTDADKTYSLTTYTEL